LAENTNKREFM